MLAMLLNACTGFALNAINVPSRVHSEQSVTRDIAYGPGDHQTLDLYQPASGVHANRQLVIFIYGGGWTSGQKEHYYFVADALTRAGYSVAIPDYVKYPEAQFPAFVEDVALAVAWLSRNREQFGDVQELIIMGHSAGAHTGALLITDPEYLAAHQLAPADIAAFVGLAGPYGFTPKEEKYQNVFGNLDDYSQMQPLHFVNGNEPPMLLLHGNDDTTVLPVNTRKFSDKVNAKGGYAATRLYADRGHIDLLLALSRVVDREGEVRGDILEFLRRELPAPDVPADA
tara:strand:- start:44776 stop:45630 length:855 start_codon:yes stop_codon:yes gene_type:complete